MRIESKSKNKIVYGWGSERVVDDVLRNVLSLVNDNLYAKNIKYYVHTSSGYGDLTVEVKNGMTYEELMDDFMAASRDYLAEQARKREEWLKSPDGIAQTKADEQKKKEHDEFVYHSFDEVVDALKQIKPCDLTSETSSLKDALKLCEDVMLVMMKAEDLSFSSEQKEKFSKMLRALGCCAQDEAAQKFIKLPKGSGFGVMSVSENNIEFPLFAFTNIHGSPASFNFGLEIVGSNDAGFGKDWLETQQKAKAKAVEQA